MKCGICKKAIAMTFLNKLIGTYIKDEKGKQHAVCFECQQKFPETEDLLKQLK